MHTSEILTIDIPPQKKRDVVANFFQFWLRKFGVSIFEKFSGACKITDFFHHPRLGDFFNLQEALQPSLPEISKKLHPLLKTKHKTKGRKVREVYRSHQLKSHGPLRYLNHGSSWLVKVTVILISWFMK